MDLKQRIGFVLSRSSRDGYIDGLIPDTLRKLGGSYWNVLDNVQKYAYLNLTRNMLRDEPYNDPHLFQEKDEAFQQAIIGQTDIFISELDQLLTEEYRNSEAFGYPDEILDTVKKNLGGYTYEGLLKALAYYQNNPSIKDSRASRYNEDGTAKIVPLSATAKRDAFRRYDMIYEGMKILKSKPPKDQHELLINVLPANTNMGWPFFITQTKDNFFKKWVEFCDMLNLPKPVEYLTVDYILKVVSVLHKREIYPPFVSFYRTHWVKVRAVFGGNIIMKLIGLLFVASKHLGYTREVADKLGLQVQEDKYDLAENGVKIYSPGNYPVISQLNWDEQFELYRDKLPPVEDGSVLPVDHLWIKEKFGIEVPPGEYFVNIVGDDYSKFDTTIIPEDYQWLAEHKGLGKLFAYVFAAIEFSDVWIGGYRVKDIIYKSGHPFTADVGTDIHRNRNYAYQDSVKDRFCLILANTNQADDSIIACIGFDLKEMSDFMKEYGLNVKPANSVDFIRDKVVTYLQMHIGYVLKSEVEPQVVGNPSTRYPKLAHSERAIEEEASVGALTGVFEVTGDPMLDAAISKLASFGRQGDDIVRTILRIVKGTISGRKIIDAINNIDPDRSYELYRSDVVFGMNPAWLGTLDIQEYLVSAQLHRATEI
jgi:hypothetical protein